jgi:hypothetical protein
MHDRDSELPSAEQSSHPGRRRLLRAIAAGGGTAAVGLLPSGWVRPRIRPVDAAGAVAAEIVHARPPTPAGFTPYVDTDVSLGATLALYFKAPRRVILVVQQFPAGTDFNDPNGPVPPLVGYVPLGVQGPGAVFFAWDYTVNGQRLAPGDYLIDVVGADDTDRPLGMYSPEPYRLTIAPDGSVQAALWLSFIWVVAPDGTVSLLNPDGTPLAS